MPPQRNSRTDWRWRVARDTGTQPSEPFLLTTPTANTTEGKQELPAFFSVAFKRRYTDRGFVFGSTALLITPPDTPFIPPDFPNPRGYRRSVELLTWLQTRRPLYDDQEVEPFFQTDWPVPKGRPFPLEDRGFIAGSPLILTATPFNQTDWPVPRGYNFPLSNRGFVAGSPLIVIATPFNQLDWPVPKGYKFPPSLRGYILPSSPDRLLAPFSQLDWPVPKGRPFPPHLRGYLLSTDRMLVATPFNQFDWPVPKGRPYPIALRFLGPQLLTYIYRSLGFGLLTDQRADGGRLMDMLVDAGLLEDLRAMGGSLTDLFGDGGSINDDRADGGSLTDA